MNQYVTGMVIRQLREKSGLTQLQQGGAEARFRIRGVRKFYYYCNRDGLFCEDAVRPCR